MTDRQIEKTVALILRAGVLLSGSIVLGGGLYFLARHGSEHVNFRLFQAQPAIDRVVHQIVLGAVHLRARSIIQFGILLLIATPIVRVAVSLVDFAIEKDWTYVWITAFVFAVLMFSLLSGAVGG
jgi:uncharacterized membrane protein